MAGTGKDKEVTFEIKERIGVLSQGGKGWTTELNMVSWNGREAKYDLRPWDTGHIKMGKGITLTREEAKTLASLLETWLAAHP